MAHVHKDQVKLLNRVRRIRGQVDAIEKAIQEEDKCGDLLQLIAAARGALNSLMSEVVEGHVRYHVVDPSESPRSPRSRAAQELLVVLKRYMG